MARKAAEGREGREGRRCLGGASEDRKRGKGKGERGKGEEEWQTSGERRLTNWLCERQASKRWSEVGDDAWAER